MRDESGEKDDDVLPPPIGQLLGLAWILLFAGRWIIVQLLLAAQILSPTLVADLDDQVLLRLYLVLLAVTITVLALRATRAAQRRPAAKGDPARRDATPGSDSAGPASLDAADRRPNTGD